MVSTPVANAPSAAGRSLDVFGGYAGGEKRGETKHRSCHCNFALNDELSRLESSRLLRRKPDDDASSERIPSHLKEYMYISLRAHPKSWVAFATPPTRMSHLESAQLLQQSELTTICRRNVLTLA